MSDLIDESIFCGSTTRVASKRAAFVAPGLTALMRTPSVRTDAGGGGEAGALEGRIDAPVRPPELRRGRADVDHRSAARRHHRRHERLTDEDRAIEGVLGQ